ncbi:hypothetical protein GE061_020258 [Apolygus lucorum]|uniref:C2H2-type domain-containing protein n=1 Tax=Apolygus lucorum TaxID=248454 RepID=A0A8S9WM32_APOLU|nr:hypothetical protein GE061_020258 [Apolygus lucorum]
MRVSGDAKFTCSKCQKKYRHYQSLYNHQSFECGKEPTFACNYCPFKTRWKHGLKSHVINRHSNINYDQEQTPSTHFLDQLTMKAHETLFLDTK